MCLILAPDIIVAAKLMELEIWENTSGKYSISISECLKKQKQIFEGGFGNVVADVSEQEIYDFLERSSVFECDGLDRFAIKKNQLNEWDKSHAIQNSNHSQFANFLREKVLEFMYPSRVLFSLRID